MAFIHKGDVARRKGKRSKPTPNEDVEALRSEVADLKRQLEDAQRKAHQYDRNNDPFASIINWAHDD